MRPVDRAGDSGLPARDEGVTRQIDRRAAPDGDHGQEYEYEHGTEARHGARSVAQVGASRYDRDHG